MCNEGMELVLNFQSPASLQGQERKEETLNTCMRGERGVRPLQEGEDGKEGWERLCACMHENGWEGRKGAERDEKRRRKPRASTALVYSRLITITARSLCAEEGDERCAHASHSHSLCDPEKGRNRKGGSPTPTPQASNSHLNQAFSPLMCNEGMELVLNFQSPASLRGQERKEETLNTCMRGERGVRPLQEGKGKENAG